MKYVLLVLALTACTVPAVTQPAVVILPTAIAPVAAPVVLSPPVALPAPVVMPAPSPITITLTAGVLTIKLADDLQGTWLRLTLPDGLPSGATDYGPCHCLGLGGASAHRIDVNYLPDLVITTSPTLDGPWTVAATP